MSKEIKIEVGYHKNGNKRYEIPRLNGKEYGLARWWHSDGKLFIESNYKNGKMHGLRRLWYNGSIYFFDFWHKGTELVEFDFNPKLKATAPKTNKPIFSTNQFLQLCQRKEQ